MNAKLEAFIRESRKEAREEMTIEERLKGLSAEEMVRALPSETLEALTRQLKANDSSSKPQ